MSTTPQKILTTSRTDSSFMFRAECIADVGRLLTQFGEFALPKTINVRIYPAYAWSNNVPDVKVKIQFMEPQTLETVQKCLNALHDGHVMAETVNYTEDYTGHRSS